MFVDSWGRWSDTIEEAKEKILNGFRLTDNSYYETIGEYLNIPAEFIEWIASNHWEEFKQKFSKEIEQAELDWAEYYFDEIKTEDELDEWEDDCEPDDIDNDCGYDPYMGCYTDDC